MIQLEYGTKSRVELPNMLVDNGDLWAELIQAAGSLTRTQVRRLMMLYSPESPAPVATLWAVTHRADTIARNPLLKKFAFNYRRNPYEDTYDPTEAALRDIDHLQFFPHRVSSRLSKERLLTEDGILTYKYEEFFTPHAYGKWLTEITHKLFMDRFRTLHLDKKLVTYRLLASDHPLGNAFLEPRECV